IQQVKAYRSDLAKRQMDRHHDRRRGQGELFEILQADFVEIRIGGKGMETLRVHPKRLAFKTTCGGKRRGERQPLVAPPGSLIGAPLKDLCSQDPALRVDRSLFTGDVVSGRGTHSAG